MNANLLGLKLQRLGKIVPEIEEIFFAMCMYFRAIGLQVIDVRILTKNVSD